jgi:hypothetical protein
MTVTHAPEVLHKGSRSMHVLAHCSGLLALLLPGPQGCCYDTVVCCSFLIVLPDRQLPGRSD